MSQLQVFFTSLGLFDLGVDPATAHLALTEDLETAIALSLLTDKRAISGQVPAGRDVKGWWGDTYPLTQGDSFGSWLWTLEGAPQNEDTLQLADAYARDALKWLIDDGIADRLEVQKEFAPPGLRVRIGVV